MFLELLVFNLRSTTFALQKLMSDIPGFRGWYATKQGQMKANEKLRWIVDTRNAAEKEGLVAATFGPCCIQRHYRNGEVKSEPGLPTLSVAHLGPADILDTLNYSAEYIFHLVEEAHSNFMPSPSNRTGQIQCEFVRECADGSWERFNPQ